MTVQGGFILDEDILSRESGFGICSEAYYSDIQSIAFSTSDVYRDLAEHEYIFNFVTTTALGANSLNCCFGSLS